MWLSFDSIVSSFKGRPAATTYLSAPLVAMELANADFSTWSRESLEFFWWSVIRLICLHLACRNYQSSSTSASSTVMVCTAALECLLEILSSTPAGCPPTELPEGFQQALQAFCVAKTLPSASMALHLDDYDSCELLGSLIEAISYQFGLAKSDAYSINSCRRLRRRRW